MSAKQRVLSKIGGQVGRFGLVGILNTVVDVVIVNVLVHFGLGIVIAGAISGTIAMVNSFIFNQRFTFKVNRVKGMRVVYFFVITMFGLYVIRPLILNFFTKQWLAPGEIVYQVTHSIGLPLSKTFDSNNFALGVAIVVVLGYNFVMYKKFVFVEDKA